MVVFKPGRVNQSTTFLRIISIIFVLSNKFISKNVLNFESIVNFCDKIQLVIEMTTLQT